MGLHIKRSYIQVNHCELMNFELETVIRTFSVISPRKEFAYILHGGREENLISNDQKG